MPPCLYMGFLLCMHTTMANENYEKEWKKFLKCKECWTFKELNDVNRYKHPDWFMWVLWRCKDCIKKWRKSEHEISMARIRDRDRYKNNPKRRSYVHRLSRERTKIHMLENKCWIKNHERTNRYIRKLWIRPQICPLCWYEWRIVAHHPDINERNKIVFCCQPCHDKIHRWKIECPTPINLLNLNLIIQCECEDE